MHSDCTSTRCGPSAPSPDPATKKPWLKFFPSDWRGDERLAMCSFGARGFLVELICIMHVAEPRGHLLINGLAPTDSELTRLVRADSVKEMRRYRDELLQRGVLSTDGNGVIYSRRMLRESARSLVGIETGKRGGNPTLKNSAPLSGPLSVTLKGLATPHIPEARNQKPEKNVRRREARHPDDAQLETGYFVKRFCELYTKHRNGATYHIIAKRHIPLIRQLLRTYGRERLEKLAVIMLSATTDTWLTNTDRGIEVLNAKVNWLESVLAEHERRHGPMHLEDYPAGGEGPAHDAWARVLERIDVRLNDRHTWFGSATVKGFSGQTLLVEHDSERIAWIERHYRPTLNAALAHEGLALEWLRTDAPVKVGA